MLNIEIGFDAFLFHSWFVSDNIQIFPNMKLNLDQHCSYKISKIFASTAVI